MITHAHGDHARARLRATCGALGRRPAAPPARARGDRRGPRVRRAADVRRRHRLVPSRGTRPRLRAGPHRARGRGLGRLRRLQARARPDAARRSSSCRCDIFITEATFGLPIYRWDPTTRWSPTCSPGGTPMPRAGRASVLFCYALGKAQRVLAELGRAHRPAGLRARRGRGADAVPIATRASAAADRAGRRAGREGEASPAR